MDRQLYVYELHFHIPNVCSKCSCYYLTVAFIVYVLAFMGNTRVQLCEVENNILIFSALTNNNNDDVAILFYPAKAKQRSFDHTFPEFKLRRAIFNTSCFCF